MKVGKEKGDFELTSGMKVGCLEVIHRETANPNGCLEHAQRCSKCVLSLGYLWVGNLGACSSPRGEPQGLEVGGQPCWRDCPAVTGLPPTTPVPRCHCPPGQAPDQVGGTREDFPQMQSRDSSGGGAPRAPGCGVQPLVQEGYVFLWHVLPWWPLCLALR